MRMALVGWVLVCMVGVAGVAGADGAVTADQISSSRSQSTPVWIQAGAVNYQRDPLTRDCEWVPATPVSTLPEGLRVLAHVATAKCGVTYLFLDLPVEIYRERRTPVAWTTLDAVTLTPPAEDPWRDAPAVGNAFIRSTQQTGFTRVAPIDDPGWTEPIRLGPGEAVEVLDAELAVIRTPSGHTAAIAPWGLVDEDPLLGGSLGPYRTLRDRFVAGRAHHERAHSLSYLPASENLVASGEAGRGRAYEFELEPEWLSAEQFQADWLDPVGQILEHECDPRRRSDDEPCGVYYLDYSAFGAWWPHHDKLVVALADGTREIDGRLLPVLRIVVREPWSKKLEVSPSWDRP
jgi:hypothetical protein